MYAWCCMPSTITTKRADLNRAVVSKRSPKLHNSQLVTRHIYIYGILQHAGSGATACLRLLKEIDECERDS